MSHLKAGDYLLPNGILFERKTAEDFVSSLIAGRLFGHAGRMVHYRMRHCFIIEGNPYRTNHEISIQAVKGALVSLALSWRIPVLFSSGKEDTAALIAASLHQEQKEVWHYPYHKALSIKKNLHAQALFIGALPGVGRKTALLLLERFGSIRAIAGAATSELMTVQGLGQKRAEKVYNFLNQGFSQK